MTKLSSSDRTGITAMATSLNNLRIEANTFASTAPQAGVYGDIATALRNTLYLLIVDGSTVVREHVLRQRAEGVYRRLLNGDDVYEALQAEQAERDAQVAEIMGLL